MDSGDSGKEESESCEAPAKMEHIPTLNTSSVKLTKQSPPKKKFPYRLYSATIRNQREDKSELVGKFRPDDFDLTQFTH